MDDEPVVYANPFWTWSDLLRDLKDRWMIEMRRTEEAAGPPKIMSPYTAEVVGGMAGIVRQLEAAAKRIDNLARTDPAAFAAFQKVIGTRQENVDKWES